MKEKELKNLIRQTNDFCQPNNEWVKNTRNLLMNEIEPQESKTSLFWLKVVNQFVPQNLSTQPVAVFSLVLGLFLITSFAAVNASNNTLPGDALYPVKITAENVKYNLAFSNNAKAVAAMSMVQNRVGELKMIMAKEDNGEKEVKVAEATDKIKVSLNKVKDKVQNISEDVDSMDTVKEIDKKLAYIKDEINQVSTLRQAQGQQEDTENSVGEELAQVVEDVEQATQVAMAALVDDVQKDEDVNKDAEGGQMVEGEVVEQETEETNEQNVEGATSTEVIEESETQEDEEVEEQPVAAPDFNDFLGEEEEDGGEFGVKIGE